MYNCIIIDDELSSIISLKRQLSKIDNIIVLKTFSNELEALSFLKSNTINIDIVFLDIKMPKISGLEIASFLKNNYSIIFTSNSSNFALNGFDVGAIDYLVKPISLERLKMGVSKAIQFEKAKKMITSTLDSEKNVDTINVVSNRKNFQILIHEIIYVESLKEYVCYYTTKNKILCLGSLKESLTQLANYNFVQIHKSYIVNTKYIISYNKQEVNLENEITLPLGRVFKSTFNK